LWRAFLESDSFVDWLIILLVTSKVVLDLQIFQLLIKTPKLMKKIFVENASFDMNALR
jgi:hypothetical protein